jgi:hypothetical protein
MTRLLVTARIAPCSPTTRDSVRNGVATVEFDHDAEVIGQVFSVGGSDKWIEADLVVESDDPEVLARIRPGTPVSLGGKALASASDLELRLKRHLLVHLEHVAILKEGQIGAIPGAKILSVREAKSTATDAAAGVDWRKLLPREYEGFRADSIDLQPGEELVLGSVTRHGIVWDGHGFSRPHARAA